MHDFRARKAYLSAVADKNAEIRRLGAAEAYTAALRAAEAAETRQTAELQRNLRRMHHLVSTASQPGILNNPYHKSLGLTQTVRGKPLEEVRRRGVRVRVRGFGVGYGIMITTNTTNTTTNNNNNTHTTNTFVVV